MKANLKELRELVLFSEDKNTSFRSGMINLMWTLVIEPIQQGVYESEEFDESFFQKNDDILKGIDFLEDLGFDMEEEFNININ